MKDLTVADRRVLPMLLSQGMGAETERPLATVVVGGLIGSIALTLVLLPLTCEWVRRRTSVGNCLQEGTGRARTRLTVRPHDQATQSPMESTSTRARRRRPYVMAIC
jgi:hypothetical protein